MKIGFIGTGNMGGALIRGYAEAEHDNQILIYDKNPEQAEKFKGIKKVTISQAQNQLLEEAHIIVLAVKPNIFPILLPQIKKELEEMNLPDSGKIFISIAAGISLDYLHQLLGENAKSIRAMPNLPAMVGYGMTAVARDSQITDEELKSALDIFNGVGKAAEVDEGMMDTVIGVSGSSPAYVYMFIDALVECAVRNGMDRDTARIFAGQATIGAATMAINSAEELSTLIDNVCSPGGTTIEAVTKLKENGFQQDLEDGMTAAIEKSKKMTK